MKASNGIRAKRGRDILQLPRRLYDWVLSWSRSKWASPALAAIAAAESIFFPIPPDVLLIPLSLSAPRRSFWYASICTTGSVAGAVVGYTIGRGAMDLVGWPIIHTYHFEEVVNVAFGWYAKWGVLALAIAGFSPIPFKVFTITSGVLGMAFVPFVIVAALSRASRFFLVGGLIFLFGEKVASLIDRHFNLLSLIFAALLVLGIFALGFI